MTIIFWLLWSMLRVTIGLVFNPPLKKKKSTPHLTMKPGSNLISALVSLECLISKLLGIYVEVNGTLKWASYSSRTRLYNREVYFSFVTAKSLLPNPKYHSYARALFNWRDRKNTRLKNEKWKCKLKCWYPDIVLPPWILPDCRAVTKPEKINAWNIFQENKRFWRLWQYICPWIWKFPLT